MGIDYLQHFNVYTPPMIKTEPPSFYTVNSKPWHKSQSRPHRCTHPGCNKSFNRSEHLSRHSQNHKERTDLYCARCRTAFTRRDLLERHIQRHKDKDAKAGGVGLGKLATRKRLWVDDRGVTHNSKRPKIDLVAEAKDSCHKCQPALMANAASQPEVQASQIDWNCGHSFATQVSQPSMDFHDFDFGGHEFFSIVNPFPSPNYPMSIMAPRTDTVHNFDSPLLRIPMVCPYPDYSTMEITPNANPNFSVEQSDFINQDFGMTLPDHSATAATVMPTPPNSSASSTGSASPEQKKATLVTRPKEENSLDLNFQDLVIERCNQGWTPNWTEMDFPDPIRKKARA